MFFLLFHIWEFQTITSWGEKLQKFQLRNPKSQQYQMIILEKLSNLHKIAHLGGAENPELS